MFNADWEWQVRRNPHCARLETRNGSAYNQVGVLHTTENSLGSSAENVSAWQNRQTKVYSGYHFLVDTKQVVYQCNPLTTRAFHAGRSLKFAGQHTGNNQLSVSMVAEASKFPYDNIGLQNKLIDNTAKLLVDIYHEFGIPLIKITPEDYLCGKRGWLGHMDVAINEEGKLGRKSDPGKDFPWGQLMVKANSLLPKEVEVEQKPDFLLELEKELKSVDAKPTSLRYTLQFYRELAKHFGISGADPARVAKELYERVGETH